MVQATQSRMRNNATPSRGTQSATGGLLPQSQMRAIVVIVANVIGKESFQVPLVCSDDVIEPRVTDLCELLRHIPRKVVEHAQLVVV